MKLHVLQDEEYLRHSIPSAKSKTKNKKPNSSPCLEIDNVTYSAGATSVPKTKCFLLLWSVTFSAGAGCILLMALKLLLQKK